MIHEIRCGIWGKFGDIEVGKDNAKKIMDHIIEFYLSKNIKLTKDELQKLLSKDIDLSADEAIKKGLVDEIFSFDKIL